MSNRRPVPQPAGRLQKVDRPLSVVVAGGGIAGLAAATVLAERGAHVTLIESQAYLGGRAGSWMTQLADGSTVQMERGFHAFFRHYYNLRELLRRVDPELERLVRLRDYPIFAPGGQRQSFEDLPTRAPANVLALVRRSDSFPIRDLLRVNGLAALEMLRYEDRRTFVRFDDMSAAKYLDSLNFPPAARHMLFDVFAHSFFNPEEEMSAAELLMMFHYYFMGNREGLVFDVLDEAFGPAVWGPLGRRLEALGGEVRLETQVSTLDRDGARWSVATTTNTGVSGSLSVDAVVLALSVPGLKPVLSASSGIGDAAWRDRIRGLELTRAFAVWRRWLDRPTAVDRHPFVGTTGYGVLDNISLYHKFERESREWAERTGGSVVELHAYAVPDDMPEASVRDEMIAGLHDLYPETVGAGVVDERYLLRRDCPAFQPGSHASRPTVDTGVPGLVLAGDFVRLPFPSALMERAASSGMLAANTVLGMRDVEPEPLYSIPVRGPLRAWRPF